MNEIVKKVKNYVLKVNKEFIDNPTNNKYDYYNEHIKYVVKNSLDLAEEYGADKEIVEIGALLHDIAGMLKVGTRADHHITGAEIAGNLLKEFNYPNEKINKVKNIILHHRSSKNSETIEELCVADADIIAHFDNVLMLCSSVFGVNQNNLADGRKILKDSLIKDFNDISDKSKHKIKEKYDLIIRLLFPD